MFKFDIGAVLRSFDSKGILGKKIIEEMNSSTVEKITMKLSENTEQHEGEDEQVNVDDI